MEAFSLGLIVGTVVVLLIQQYRSGDLRLNSHGSSLQRVVVHPFAAHCGGCSQCSVCGRTRNAATHR